MRLEFLFLVTFISGAAQPPVFRPASQTSVTKQSLLTLHPTLPVLAPHSSIPRRGSQSSDLQSLNVP